MSISTFFARGRTIESITAPITNIVAKLQTHAEIHTGNLQAHQIKAAMQFARLVA